MITETLILLTNGAKQVLHQPRIMFVLLLVIVFPVLLTAMLQQFLLVASDNYSTAARQRIGTVHDATALLGQATNIDVTVINSYIKDMLTANQDIKEMVVAKQTDGGIVLVSSNDEQSIGGIVQDESPYTRALAVAGDPIAAEFFVKGERFWDTTSSFTHNNERWFVVTRQSFGNFDDVLFNREVIAYGVLGLAFIFLFGLGYWLIRDIDYKTKYQFIQQKLDEQGQISNMIAHELRSPLTAMRGYASMISEHTKEGEQIHEHATRITDATERLVRLVNDFLEVARLQSGQLAIVPAPVTLSKIITHACDELRPLAVEKNLELLADVVGTETLILMSDEARLHQILTNLTSNAIKYTPSGRVTVELRDTRRTVEIRVKDTGTGISADDQKKLFAPFFRVQSEYTSTVTGTGLGMWITKKLIERLGGTIGIESIKGVGTQIVVTFTKLTAPKE